MRLLEASHVVEILREAGPGGLHVDTISEKNGVDPKKLGLINPFFMPKALIRFSPHFTAFSHPSYFT